MAVADPARPPIEKACGEGLMPGGVAALRNLGVEISSEDGHPFRGIRFTGYGRSVAARFPQGAGIGMRRTVLHDRLVEHARAAGVEFLWGAPVSLDGTHRARAGGSKIAFAYLAGADGGNSAVRRWAGLDRLRTDSVRFGFRRHYRVAPWSDSVEVHWTPGCQVYITPVAAGQVCVATLTRDRSQRLADALALFPELERRLAGAEAVTPERGAPSYSRRLYRVTDGNVALIGDASGSVDAVTGEGMSLTFRQAAALGDALAHDDLTRYERAHARIRRAPDRSAFMMMLMDRSCRIGQRAIRALSGKPDVFSSLLAHHVGDHSLTSFARTACALGWCLVTSY